MTNRPTPDASGPAGEVLSEVELAAIAERAAGTPTFVGTIGQYAASVDRDRSALLASHRALRARLAVVAEQSAVWEQRAHSSATIAHKAEQLNRTMGIAYEKTAQEAIAENRALTDQLAATTEIAEKNIKRADEYWIERNDLCAQLAAKDATIAAQNEYSAGLQGIIAAERSRNADLLAALDVQTKRADLLSQLRTNLSWELHDEHSARLAAEAKLDDTVTDLPTTHTTDHAATDLVSRSFIGGKLRETHRSTTMDDRAVAVLAAAEKIEVIWRENKQLSQYHNLLVGLTDAVWAWRGGEQ